MNKTHNTMSPEEQRIAIAEACGWTETEAWLNGRRCFEHADSNAGWDFDSLPDYLNDLNACREFEEVLNSPKYMQFHAFNNYAAMLCEMCKHEYNAIAATAAQRCEAFLKTIDRWKE